MKTLPRYKGYDNGEEFFTGVSFILYSVYTLVTDSVWLNAISGIVYTIPTMPASLIRLHLYSFLFENASSDYDEKKQYKHERHDK